jgi:hypothetical protein
MQHQKYFEEKTLTEKKNKKQLIKTTTKATFCIVCYDAIVLKIKSYLIFQTHFAYNSALFKMDKMELGMLINFGMSSLTYKRMVNLKIRIN